MLYSKIEGEGIPFLIIHGFLGMSDNWKTLGKQFSNEGYQMHLIDMRNHGKSFHSDDFSYELMVDDLKKYCEEKNLEEIVLLGHSMGGKVAMLFACKFPNLVTKLIVADIGPKFYAPHHQTILEGLTAIDFSLKPSRVEVENILSFYINDQGTRQFLLKNLYWKEPGQLAFRFNLFALVKNIDKIGEALSQECFFNGEVFFIRGGNSNYILDKDWDGILRYFPNSKLSTIENAGHWLHAEQPEIFYNEVVSFIKGE